MAQIPDWTALPQAVPNPSYRRVQVDDSAARVYEGIAGVGQTLERVGNDQWTQQQQLADAKAQNAVEQHDLALKTTAEGMHDDILSGKVPYAQAREQFDQQVQKIPQPDFTGLRAPVAQLLQGRVQRNIAQTQFGIDHVVDAARKDDFKAQFGQGLDTLGKLAGMPDANIEDINARADVYRPLGRNAGLPEAFIDKALQDFKDRNWLNQATQRSMEAKESLPALGQLQHDLTAADGFYAGKLDTDKRNMVLRSVENDQIILKNRLEHEQDKREARAQSAIGRIDEQISSGVPATPDMWDKWQGLTRGTSFEEDFKQRLKDEDTVQNVLRQPIAQQQTYVQQQQQKLDQEGGTLRDKANLTRLQTAVNQNVNLMQKAPLLFAANRNGTEVAPLDFSAVSTPASGIQGTLQVLGGQGGEDHRQQFQAQIADRMATLKALRTQYGPQIAQLPLLPQEASQLSSQLDNATPGQRAQMLVGLRGAMNDDQAYQNTMRQIAPHSPVTAIAGSMVGNSAPASTAMWFDQKYAPKMEDAAVMLSGDSLLNPNKATTGQQEKGELKSTVPMPSDGAPNSPGLREKFFNEAKDLFRDRPQLGEAYFAAFKAADAGLRAKAGDLKGEMNYSIENQALKIALGNTIDFNGSKVKVPIGMDPTKFKGYVNNALAAVVKGAGGGADWADRIQGYRLHEGDIGAGDSGGGIGSGRYTIMDGPIPMMRPDGKGPLTIDLRKQYAP